MRITPRADKSSTIGSVMGNFLFVLFHYQQRGLNTMKIKGWFSLLFPSEMKPKHFSLHKQRCVLGN